MKLNKIIMFKCIKINIKTTNKFLIIIKIKIFPSKIYVLILLRAVLLFFFSKVFVALFIAIVAIQILKIRGT